MGVLTICWQQRSRAVGRAWSAERRRLELGLIVTLSRREVGPEDTSRLHQEVATDGPADGFGSSVTMIMIVALKIPALTSNHLAELTAVKSSLKWFLLAFKSALQAVGLFTHLSYSTQQLTCLATEASWLAYRSCTRVDVEDSLRGGSTAYIVLAKLDSSAMGIWSCAYTILHCLRDDMDDVAAKKVHVRQRGWWKSAAMSMGPPRRGSGGPLQPFLYRTFLPDNNSIDLQLSASIYRRRWPGRSDQPQHTPRHEPDRTAERRTCSLLKTLLVNCLSAKPTTASTQSSEFA